MITLLLTGLVSVTAFAEPCLPIESWGEFQRASGNPGQTLVEVRVNRDIEIQFDQTLPASPLYPEHKLGALHFESEFFECRILGNSTDLSKNSVIIPTGMVADLFIPGGNARGFFSVYARSSVHVVGFACFSKDEKEIRPDDMIATFNQAVSFCLKR